MKRGDIVTVASGKPRPAVVVQSDHLLPYPMVIVVARQRRATGRFDSRDHLVAVTEQEGGTATHLPKIVAQAVPELRDPHDAC